MRRGDGHPIPSSGGLVSVPIRMTARPVPGRGDDLADVLDSGHPSELALQAIRACDQLPRVARPASHDLVWDRATDDLLAGPKDFEDGRSRPRADVVEPPHAGLQGLDGEL